MTSPSRRRFEKKSETLEVRLTLSEKQALAEHCSETGVSASALVRSLLSQRVRQPAWRRFLRLKGPDMPEMKPLLPAAAIAIAGSLALAAASPSTASDYRSAFAALDSNGDGAVSEGEFLSVADSDWLPVDAQLRDGGRTISRREWNGEIRQEFALYDRNRNGLITYAEFSGRYGSIIEAAFDHFDRDADGRVTAAELDAGMAVEAADGAALIAEFDTDGDHALTFDEFVGREG